MVSDELINQFVKEFNIVCFLLKRSKYVSSVPCVPFFESFVLLIHAKPVRIHDDVCIVLQLIELGQLPHRLSISSASMQRNNRLVLQVLISELIHNNCFSHVSIAIKADFAHSLGRSWRTEFRKVGRLLPWCLITSVLLLVLKLLVRLSLWLLDHSSIQE